MDPENELQCCWDIAEKLQLDLLKTRPGMKAMKARVLKNIFLIQKRGVYKFQLEFIEQDLVIFSHTMDIAEFMNINQMNIRNQEEDFRGRIIIPRVILKIGFSGMGRDEFKIQVKTASDIKSIFPDCKYFLLFLYKGIFSETDGKEGWNPFDQVICFSPKKSIKNIRYRKGDFDLLLDRYGRTTYDHFVQFVHSVLDHDRLSTLK